MIEQSLQPLRALAACRVLLLRIAILAGVVFVAACSTTQTLEVAPPPPPPTVTSDRYAAIVIDGGNGAVLYASNQTAPRYPASLTKMMTLYLLFEALDTGRVSKETPIPVSRQAARQPPTKIGFKAGETIDVEAAIHALTVKSANDVAYAVGEFLGGSEAGFAQQMNAKARQIGMTGTVFANASGLPDDAQHTTARDMAVLGLSLRARFPQYYSYFSTTDFTFRGRLVRGHNDLLGRVQGVDGIKTGYIRASGFNIVTSVRTGGRSLVIVVMGADSARARNDHVEQLINTYLPRANGGGQTTRQLFSAR